MSLTERYVHARILINRSVNMPGNIENYARMAVGAGAAELAGSFGLGRNKIRLVVIMAIRGGCNLAQAVARMELSR